MTEDRQRFGSRLLALAALWLLLSGLLLSLSFVDVVLFANGVMLIAVAVVGTVWLLRRVEFERKLALGVLLATRRARDLGIPQQAKRLGLGVVSVSTGVLAWTGRTVRGLSRRAHDLGIRRRAQRLRLGVAALAGGVLASAVGVVRGARRRSRHLNVRPQVERLGRRARQGATGVPGGAKVIAQRAIRSYAVAAYRLQMRTAQALLAAERRLTFLSHSRPPPAGDRRQALQLNARGAQLRRQGDHEQAAEQHRVALAIVRDLGDEEVEALTLNNLALALAQCGAEEEAVEHLEQAREVLHELGDEEHEAQVIANLGMVHRRQGHSEEAVTLLHEALEKLPPESTAYRQLKELVRAS